MVFECSFVSNNSATADIKERLHVRYSLIDKYNSVVDTKTADISIYGRKKATDTVSFSPQKYGLYRLKIEVGDEKSGIYSSHTARCAYIRSAKGKIKNNKHWISYGIPLNNEDAENMAKMISYAGFGGVRVVVDGVSMFRTSYNNLDVPQLAVTDVLHDTLGSVKKYGLDVMLYTHVGGNNAAPAGNLEADKSEAPYTGGGRTRRWKIDEYILENFGSAMAMWQIDNEMDLSVPTNADRHAANYGNYCNYAIPKTRELIIV